MRAVGAKFSETRLETDAEPVPLAEAGEGAGGTGYSAAAGAHEWHIKEVWCDKKQLSVGDVMRIEYAPTVYRVVSVGESFAEVRDYGRWSPSYRVAVVENVETGARIERKLGGGGHIYRIVGGEKLERANAEPSLVSKGNFDRWLWQGEKLFGNDTLVPIGTHGKDKTL
jgi:hypothetical protein